MVDIPARLVTVVKTPPGQPDIRRFDVEAINDAIDRQMATLKPGETVACIAHVDVMGGNLAIVGKLPEGLPGDAKWTVYAHKRWDGEWGAGAALRWSI